METGKEQIPEELQSSPIPLEIPIVRGWKEIPVFECGESLVALGTSSPYPQIFTDSIYYGERDDSPYRKRQALRGSLMTCFVRERVAKQLSLAQKLLPLGYFLIVYDTYRPLMVQASLYSTYVTQLKILHPDWSKGALAEETQKYVSLPSANPFRPSPHNTGGAVDLAIISLSGQSLERALDIDSKLLQLNVGTLAKFQLETERALLFSSNGKVLNFGTPFDYGGVEASLNYYEHLSTRKSLTQEEIEFRNNRRLLYGVMVQAGFQPYSDEWWHYNSEKVKWAQKHLAFVRGLRSGPTIFA